MNLKEEYEQETGESATFTNVNFAQLPTPQYAEWLEAKLQTPQPEEVKEDADLVTINGKFAIVPNHPEQFPYRLELQTGYGSFFFVSGSYMHCSDVQSEITALD